MRRALLFTLCLLIVPMLSFGVHAFTPPAAPPTNFVQLGETLYYDLDLSFNGNQSCAVCHAPDTDTPGIGLAPGVLTGFADPANVSDPANKPVSASSNTMAAGHFPVFGGRNAPTSAYAAYSPVMFYDRAEKLVVGGVFWDGRATGWTLGDPLAEQALGPFLNPVEMQMPSKTVVVNESGICSDYHSALTLACQTACDNGDINGAYDCIGLAIAAYERSTNTTGVANPVNKFSSNFDTEITDPAALAGQDLFNGAAQCALCHLTTPHDAATPAVFTDFTYDNLGVPKNPEIELLAGPQPIDYGLGARVAELMVLSKDGLRASRKKMPDGLGGSVLIIKGQAGKVKVSTLRNIAVTAPYAHNGYFPDLTSIVQFYNTRDLYPCSLYPDAIPAVPAVLAAGNIPGYPEDTPNGYCWPAPEVAENVNAAELGNLGLISTQVDEIVAFMEQLTDH